MRAPAAAPLLGATGLCLVALWLLPVPWIDLDGALLFGALDRLRRPVRARGRSTPATCE